MMNPTTKDEPGPNPDPDGGGGSVANDDGSVTTYDENGCYTTRSGGTDSWRNNNPGNLNSPQPGETGTDNNGKAIFPDDETGRAALDTELRTNASPGSLVGQSIGATAEKNGWSPTNTQDIIQNLDSSGINPNKMYGEAGDKTVLDNLIRDKLGYSAGEESEQICPESSSVAGD